MKKGKKFYAVIAVSTCVLLAAGGVGWHFLSAKKETQELQQEQRMGGPGEGMFSMITGEGTTAGGEIAQKPQFDVSVVDFAVEESYVAKGDEVKQGDALYKLSAESIAAATAYYEEAIAKASKEQDSTKTAYEAGKAEAQYTKTETEATAQSAQEVYNAANSTLTQKVTEAETALQEAKDQISVYRNNLDQNTYYTDAGVEAKKTAYQKAEKTSKQAQKAYQEAKSAYDKAVDEVNTKIASLQQATSTDGTQTVTDGSVLTGLITELSQANQILTEKKRAFAEAEKTYQSAVQTTEKAMEEYNTANTSYEKAVSDATGRKESLEKSLPSLEFAYTSAANAAETGKVDNQNTYETAVLNGQYAEVTYEDTVSTLKDAYEAASEELEELKEEQSALFALQDGIITAEYDGVLAAVTYETGDVLVNEYELVSYSDTSKLTIDVEVDQANIAEVSVGDTVQVQLIGMRRERIEGTVTSVASGATSGRSMSNVTYTVQVTIDNSEGNIATETSAYVMFGDIEDFENMRRPEDGERIDGEGIDREGIDRTERPEGMERPETPENAGGEVNEKTEK